MTPDFAEFLLTIPEAERSGPVFVLPGSNGATLKQDAIGRKVSRIGRAAKVVVNKAEDQFATAHDLRRSFGTRWSSRVKPAVLQRLMRHADIKTTMAFYVFQEADDVAADLWRQFGTDSASGSQSERLKVSRNKFRSGSDTRLTVGKLEIGPAR